MPPAAMTGTPAVKTLVRRARSWTCERAVARRARHEQTLNTGLSTLPSERDRRFLRRSCPTVHGHLAVPGVDRYHEALSEPSGSAGEERGGESGGSNHDPVRACCDRRLDGVDGAIAAPDL